MWAEMTDVWSDVIEETQLRCHECGHTWWSLIGSGDQCPVCGVGIGEVEVPSE